MANPTTDTRARVPDEVQPPARWVVLLAWATPLCVLPSSLWRVYAITQIPPGCPDSPGTRVYIVGLSCVSFAAAFLTVGLVSEWGRRWPTWVPHLGGRRIRPQAVLVAACVGIAILTSVYLYAVLNPIFGWKEPNDDLPGCPPPTETDGAWLAFAAYTPLLAWMPLLAIVTADFYRRNLRRPSLSDTTTDH